MLKFSLRLIRETICCRPVRRTSRPVSAGSAPEFSRTDSEAQGGIAARNVRHAMEAENHAGSGGFEMAGKVYGYIAVLKDDKDEPIEERIRALEAQNIDRSRIIIE